MKQSSTPLQQAVSVVSGQMAEFESEYSRQFVCEDKTLTPLLSLIGKPGGKRIRPLLYYLTSGLITGKLQDTYPDPRAGVMIELLHMASLVHDDVVDNSSVRRGENTVNAVWGNKAAVLLGDYLFARVLAIGLELNWPGVLNIISRTALKMGSGELRQTLTGSSIELTEADYFRTINDKTAELFAAAGEIAGIAHETDPDLRTSLSSLGRAFGFLFQIQDDILDIEGYSATMGKPSGQDILNGNITLPMLLALNNSNGAIKAEFKMRFDRGGEEDVKWICGFIQQHGGIERASEKAQIYKDEAMSFLSGFKPSPYRETLENLIEYGLTRSW